MSYENPPVPHEVNVSRENVVAEFLRLCAGVALLAALAAALLYVAGGWLARQVPFRWEASMADGRVIGAELLDTDGAVLPPAQRVRVEAYLQALAGSLTDAMPLPDGMQVHVHLVDSDVPNAFATLGGQVVVTRGLYRRMPSENALAMVLAHELGHLRHRDPIAALGGRAAVATALALLGDGQALAPPMAAVVQLGYSRNAETRADDDALLALRQTYGHVRGAADVFRVLTTYRRGRPAGAVPTLLSTHPADAARVARLAGAARADPADAVLAPVREVLPSP